MIKCIDISEVARLVNGRILGNPAGTDKINGTCAIDSYLPNKVTFINSEKYSRLLGTMENAVILIHEKLVQVCTANPQHIYIVVDDVADSIIDLQNFFYKDDIVVTGGGISSTARIDDTAMVGEDVLVEENVSVGKRVVIGNRTKILAGSIVMDNVTIGEGTVIDPGVTIYKNCKIGNDVIISSGTRIGNEGSRFEQHFNNSTIRKMLQMGNVVIGDGVEIGCNCVINRGTFEGSSTIISKDVKICDLVGIAHNVRIGSRTIIIALSTIAGSTKIGDDVWIGAGVSIANGLSVGNRAKILLNAVVAYDVADDEVVSGFYAMPHRQWKKAYQIFREYGTSKLKK